MKPNSPLTEVIDGAVEVIRQRWSMRPRLGMILGTGSGEIADQLRADVAIPYSAIPHWPRCTALGHAGRLVCGHWHDVPLVALQGRFHLYEGYRGSDIALPIHVLQRLGMERLLITNAAGGVNPQYAVGDLMLVEDHINLFFHRGIVRSNGSACSRERYPSAPGEACSSKCGELYDRSMLEIAERSARVRGIPIRSGVYVGMLGPNYETAAEYRMVRQIGGDAVGMSTIPEVLAAGICRIPTLAVSIITNVVGTDSLQKTSATEVLEAGRRAAVSLRQLLAAVIRAVA